MDHVGQGETRGPQMLNTTCFEENISGTESGEISQRQPKGGAGNGNDWGGACFCW